MDLFICRANVWRSQCAEWFAKKFKKDVISCASVEARKEKYFYKPEKVITDIILNKYNIDISKQEIYYPLDILKDIDNLENIYFLFDPKKAKKSDKEVLIKWKTLWEYFDSIWKEYSIYEIEDPDAKDNSTIVKIVDDINLVINKIYS